MKKNISGIIFVFCILILIIPFLHEKTKIIKVKPLKGAIVAKKKPEFEFKKWMDGEFQPAEEEYVNENFGFRNIFVRINNQLSFWLFNKVNVSDVIIGKENYLFERMYIDAYKGADFIGEDSIRSRMEKLKFINDTLTKLNKSLILVFAADKATFYPEYIPEKYNINIPGKKLNFDYHVMFAKEQELNYINFNKYFSSIKNSIKYPLYPKYGIHWSNYGMYIAADSIIHYIEKLRQEDLPEMQLDTILWEKPKGDDYDVADAMNLLFVLKSFPMAYPIIHFESTDRNKKPNLLVISDSFYWGLFNMGFSNGFEKSNFWYYNNQVFPESYSQPTSVKDLNLNNEIKNHDVFIILGSEGTMYNFGWGFIENAYTLFKGVNIDQVDNRLFEKEVKDKMDYIKTDKKWMEQVEHKAKEYKISVDSMLRKDAMWVIKNK